MRRIVVAIDALTGRQRERITQSIDGWATVDFAGEHPGDWEAAISEAEVVFGWPPPEALESSPVRFFQLPSSGYEKYMTKVLMAKSGFRVANARGVTAQAVAEHCLSMMFAFTRQVPLHVRQQERHLWKQAPSYSLLAGSTIAILGLGAIGSVLAKRCHALGMRVVAVQRSSSTPEYVAESYGLDALHTALCGARHVALTISALSRSTPLFSAPEFNAMASGSYFYNMARGSLVDQNALESELRSGRLAGAGLDVFAEEPLPETSGLWELENVIISPHVAGRFHGELDALVGLFLQNLQQYRSDKPMTNLVISNP